MAAAKKSTTPARKQAAAPAFELVYSSSKKPASLHARTERECWAGHMREATAEERKALKGKQCKHCLASVAREAAEAKKAEKPVKVAQPLPRNTGQPVVEEPVRGRIEVPA